MAPSGTEPDLEQREARAWRPGLGVGSPGFSGKPLSGPGSTGQAYGPAYEATRRAPAPSLLRPPRRSGRRLLAGLALGVVGLGGGLVLGLSLRPPAAPPLVTATAPIATPAPVSTPMPAPDPVAEVAGQLAGRLAGLRDAVATEQARLDQILQARGLAEAELAGLRRDLAATRREAREPSAQASLPATPPPGPASSPAFNPPASSVLRLPRAETAAGSGQPRVFVHLRAGSSGAADAAAGLAGTLREAGFDLAELRPVTSTPSQRVVRYFHSEDAAAAARLAGRLGRGWAIQDFRSFEPAPSPQTLEIWLPDR